MAGIPKQLINLLGAVAVLAVIAAGVLLGVLPSVGRMNATTAETSDVTSANGINEARVAGLRAQEREFEAIRNDVLGLREQIPSFGRFDDVFEIAALAADEAGARIESVTADDLVPWTVRAGPQITEAEGDAPPPAEAPTDASTGASEEETDAAVDDPAAVSVTPPTNAPQQQVSFVIVVDVAGPAEAARYLDELAVGPRLVSVVHAELAEGDAGGYRLTVNALAFVRVDD